MIEKIKKLFDEIACPAIAILKTPRAGQIVDNGMGVDFQLNPYAVIHDNSIHDNDNAYSILFNWEQKHNVEIAYFAIKNCRSLEEMIKELNNVDAYEVVWRRQ